MIHIIGAGISGLSIGWTLAEAGQPVVIYDRGEAGRETSWAAGGMLAPQVEAEPGEEALLPLLLESRNRWKEFAERLEAASGIDLDYRDEGTLVVALDRDDWARLEFFANYFSEMGLQVERLTGRELLRKEPYLSRRVSGGLFSPLDHQVDNRKAVIALKAAFLRAGGTLRENCEVSAIETARAAGKGPDGGCANAGGRSLVAARGVDSRRLSHPTVRRTSYHRGYDGRCRLRCEIDGWRGDGDIAERLAGLARNLRSALDRNLGGLSSNQSR